MYPVLRTSTIPAAGVQVVADYLTAARSPNTRRAYAGAWAAFTAWATALGLPSMPAAPETVAWYLSSLAADGLSLATVRLRRAAIAAAHRAGGAAAPTDSEGVKMAMAGIARTRGQPQGQARGLSGEDLAAVAAVAGNPRRGRGGRLESEDDAYRRGAFDIALLAVMRDAMLRISEAGALAWGDVAEWPDGSGRVTVRRSKTDAAGVGAVLYLWPDTLIRLERIRPPDCRPDDPVFPLSTRQLSRRIAAACRAAGLGDGYSGHSPRIGMAEHLARAGAGLVEIQTAGRWASPSMPARYTRGVAAGQAAVARYGR